VLADSIIRLLPGVIGDAESALMFLSGWTFGTSHLYSSCGISKYESTGCIAGGNHAEIENGSRSNHLKKQKNSDQIYIMIGNAKSLRQRAFLAVIQKVHSDRRF